MRGFIGMLSAMIVCLALLFMVSSCSTLQNLWDGDADPAATKAALCQDAQLGITMADLALEQNPTGELAAYWQRWRVGAVTAFNFYCLADGGR